MNELKILLIEPNIRERTRLSHLLEDWGYSVSTTHDEIDALAKIKTDEFHLIIADYNLPGGALGTELIQQITKLDEQIRILFLVENGSVSNAVDAMKAGAVDYLVKPVEESQFHQILNIALPHHFHQGEPADHPSGGPTIVTRNKAVHNLLRLAEQVADSTASVFIQGESGTGKELFAKYIHGAGNRRNRPFIAVNCAALPETLLESELFGHEKGSFTGAIAQKPGKFELADKGTILLDEITEMQMHLQAKLLRIIQEGEVDRVGGLKPIKIDVRIIATSNRDIQQAIQEGQFREDLYFRLNTIPLTIPPLRSRPEDIEPLAEYFISKYNQTDGRNVKTLTASALNVLKNLNLRGNVRELENIIQRAVLLSDGQTIRDENLFLENNLQKEISSPEANPETISGLPVGPLKEVEKKMIFQTLDQTKGNRTHAAKILGISVRTLRNKLNEYKETLEAL